MKRYEVFPGRNDSPLQLDELDTGPLPGAKKAYGQLLSRNFNPLDIPPITANGLPPLALWRREVAFSLHPEPA